MQGLSSRADFFNHAAGRLLLAIPLLIYSSFAQATTLAPGIDGADIFKWTVGLCLVLILFFCFIFLVRRVNRYSTLGASQLSVLAGVSLGTREKVVLMKVGNKQVLLGVTPGRIQTLMTLEGEDCLGQPEQNQSNEHNNFAEKLQQAFQGKVDVC